jgi:hypothetical protein
MLGEEQNSHKYATHMLQICCKGNGGRDRPMKGRQGSSRVFLV